MDMKLLAKLRFGTVPTIEKPTQPFLNKRFVAKACQIIDLRHFSAYFRAAQIFQSHFLAAALVAHVSRSRI